MFFKLPDGSSKVDVEGLARARITEFTPKIHFLKLKPNRLI